MASAFYERAFFTTEAMASQNITYLFSQNPFASSNMAPQQTTKKVPKRDQALSQKREADIGGSSVSVSLLMMCETLSGKT